MAALALRGGGQKHTVVGQPSYNPNAHAYAGGGGYGGGYGGYQQPIPGGPGDRYGYLSNPPGSAIVSNQVALRDAQAMFGPIYT